MKRLFALALLVWLGAGAALAKTEGDAVKISAPPDPYETLAKETEWLNTERALTAEDLRGRIILLDFWTFCCVNCVHVMEDLKKLEDVFDRRLTVVGVHSAKFTNEAETDAIRQAVIRHGLSHAVVNDAQFRIWKAFGVKAWPTLVLLNPEGKVANFYIGEGHYDEMERDIRNLMQQNNGGRVRRDALPLSLEAKKLPPSLLRFPGKVISGTLPDGQQALFVADTGNNRVMVLKPDGEVLFAIGATQAGDRDGSFEYARLKAPQGLLYDSGLLFIADTGNHKLRQADLENRQVVTLAGTGEVARRAPAHARPGLKSSLASPMDMAFWPDENSIAIAMAGRQQLWRYNRKSLEIDLLAGSGTEGLVDGTALKAQLAQPSALWAQGGSLYFLDAESSALRVLDSEGVRTLVGGGLFEFGLRDGARANARMQHPLALTGNKEALFIADSYNHAIRRYGIATGKLSTLIQAKPEQQNGQAKGLNEPSGITLLDDTLVISDSNHHRLQQVPLKKPALALLDVHEPVQPLKVQYSEELPNVMKLDPIYLAKQTPLKVNLKLPMGWHINKDAPSYLALFDMYRGKRVVAAFDRHMMMQERLLLPPRVGHMYQLQGSFYYCRIHVEDSQCLVRSVDVPVRFTEDGQRGLSITIE